MASLYHLSALISSGCPCSSQEQSHVDKFQSAPHAKHFFLPVNQGLASMGPGASGSGSECCLC